MKTGQGVCSKSFKRINNNAALVLEKGATLRDHYATGSTSFSAIYLTGSTSNDSRDPTNTVKSE
jgi:hypothetical protein